MATRPSESEQPRLTPQFCFNQTALRDFLRLSRATVDDSITQNLNALVTPASDPFDPTSVSSRQVRSPARRQISPQKCATFKNEVLFPSWQTRSDVLNYCAMVATSPDPEDPDAVLRQIEDATARERVVNERLDPYSARYFPQEARTESLASLIRNERAVESIIRARTWSLVAERCGDESMEAFERWRTQQRMRLRSDNSA